MTIDEFVAHLHDGKYPGDYQLVISKVMTCPFKIADLTEDDKKLLYPDGDVPQDTDDYEIITDVPLCGIAVNDSDKEVRLLVTPHSAAYLEQHLMKLPDFTEIK